MYRNHETSDRDLGGHTGTSMSAIARRYCQQQQHHLQQLDNPNNSFYHHHYHNNHNTTSSSSSSNSSSSNHQHQPHQPHHQNQNHYHHYQQTSRPSVIESRANFNPYYDTRYETTTTTTSTLPATTTTAASAARAAASAEAAEAPLTTSSRRYQQHHYYDPPTPSQINYYNHQAQRASSRDGDSNPLIDSISLPSYLAVRDELSHLAIDDPLLESETQLKMKWLDNSPRMSRLREHRQKRLVNKLEQFELWDIEQEQKQKQYEQAREQRYKNIVERLKSQEFCVNVMKKRHESDLESAKELELYPNEHLYVDALDDPKTHYQGPITQYRKFQAEMDDKLKTLQSDLDLVNPRYRIQQNIIPRIERTRELYSIEPDIYTQRGKRVQKRPNLKNSRASEDRLLLTNLILSNKTRDGSNGTSKSSHHRVAARRDFEKKPSSETSRERAQHLYSQQQQQASPTTITSSENSGGKQLKPIIIHKTQERGENATEASKQHGAEASEKKVVNFNDDIEYNRSVDLASPPGAIVDGSN